MNQYAKDERKRAFHYAREAVRAARQCKPKDRDALIAAIAFWRNDAAYVIRKPARTSSEVDLPTSAPLRLSNAEHK
jgi:predicted nucleic acid-binding protein